MAVVIDTTSVAAPDRFEFWASAISSTFQPVESRALAPRPFRGRMTQLDLGLFKAHRVVGDAWVVQRTARAIADSDPGHVQMALQLRGRSAVTQADRTTILGPGDLTVFDTSRPYGVGHDLPFEILLFCLPRLHLGPHASRIAARAAVSVSGAVGPGKLIVPFLRDVVDTLEEGALPECAADIGEGVLDLVRALYASGDVTPNAQLPASMLLPRIKAWIDGHLDDPDLDPATIAEHHHISTRYLHRLFEEEELSVSQWVKTRRLHRCRRDLGDPALRGESILAVAQHWGFRDGPTFSRAFRSAYGISPREYRLGIEVPLAP